MTSKAAYFDLWEGVWIRNGGLLSGGLITYVQKWLYVDFEGPNYYYHWYLSAQLRWCDRLSREKSPVFPLLPVQTGQTPVEVEKTEDADYDPETCFVFHNFQVR